MDKKEIREKILKEYRNASIFGQPWKSGGWLYYTLLIGNYKKEIRWNYLTDEHEEIRTSYF